MNEKSNRILSIFLVILGSILCLAIFIYATTRNVILEEIEVMALQKEGIIPEK